MAEFHDDHLIPAVFSGADPVSIPLSSSSSISPVTHIFCSDPWPMVAIHDSSEISHLSIFPPSSHENLTPSHDDHFPPPPLVVDLDPGKGQLLASPISPFLFPRSNSDPSSSDQFDSDPDRSLPQSPTSEINLPPLPSPPLPDFAVSRWWRLAFQMIRSKFGDIRALIGRKADDSRGMVVWPFGNIWLAVAAAMWWLWLRERRRRSIQRRNSMEQLLQIMRKKDEKIVELLNQIGKMNELLMSRQKS
ncbi:hypothetical protein LINPERHAP1_LOCUS35851 [Linum perenne]